MQTDAALASEPLTPYARARLRFEIAIVLALSLGASGVYALVQFIEAATREVALNAQQVEINRPLAERPGFDLTMQLLSLVFGLAPVALVIWLTWQERRPHLGALGVARGTPLQRLREVGGGFALAAAIGVPGLVFYVTMLVFGLNLQVVPTSLGAYWWTVPVLILQALKAALTEELIVVAYLFHRLKQLGLAPWIIIVSCAVLRGSYHLYQGLGGFIGNVIMGLVFGWAYHRFGRIVPLIVAHWLLDIVSFVGYPLAVAWWPQFFG